VNIVCTDTCVVIGVWMHWCRCWVELCESGLRMVARAVSVGGLFLSPSHTQCYEKI